MWGRAWDGEWVCESDDVLATVWANWWGAVWVQESVSGHSTVIGQSKPWGRSSAVPKAPYRSWLMRRPRGGHGRRYEGRAGGRVACWHERGVVGRISRGTLRRCRACGSRGRGSMCWRSCGARGFCTEYRCVHVVFVIMYLKISVKVVHRVATNLYGQRLKAQQDSARYPERMRSLDSRHQACMHRPSSRPSLVKSREAHVSVHWPGVPCGCRGGSLN